MKKFKTVGGAKLGTTKIAPNSPKIKWLIGIDEVGRGPLAGPVAVCVCAMRMEECQSVERRRGQIQERELGQVCGKGQSPKETYKKFLKRYENEIKSRGLASLRGRDSKKLKEKDREVWYDFFKYITSTKRGVLNIDDKKAAAFFYGTKSALQIDKKGISVCISKLIEENLNKFLKLSKENIKPEEVLVLLDGSLYAPKQFINQQTIIKGDEKELIISLASIYAKVERDVYMRKISKNTKYEVYGFDKHKGYGTKMHLFNIKKYGASDVHRKTFLKSILL